MIVISRKEEESPFRGKDLYRVRCLVVEQLLLNVYYMLGAVTVATLGQFIGVHCAG